MAKVWCALKPGGVVATMDDMPRGHIEMGLEYCSKFVLNIYTLTYSQKLSIAVRRLLGLSPFPTEVFSPMEESKHSTVDDIERIWNEQHEVVVNLRQLALAGTPVMMLGGSDWFRYGVARTLVDVDTLSVDSGWSKASSGFSSDGNPDE